MDASTSLEKQRAQILRPTVVVVLWRFDRREEFQVLVARSARAEKNENKEVWMLPQGGLERNEPLWKGAYRELQEELGIPEVDLRSPYGPLLTGEIPGGDKKYFILTAAYRGSNRLVLKSDEVAEALWASRSEAACRISSTNRKAKTDLLLCGIEEAYKIVCA